MGPGLIGLPSPSRPLPILGVKTCPLFFSKACVLKNNSKDDNTIVDRFFMLRAILTVGEFKRTRHPRNVEVNEICEVNFQEQRTCEYLESWTYEVLESRTRDGLES
jgi:hypothetical protein